MTGTETTLLALKSAPEAVEFAEFLGNAGIETFAAKDGAEALEAVMEKTPALVIVDLDLPVINAERLFHILMNNAHTAGIPFLFLSESMAEIKGFRAGHDMFLLRPLNMGDLHARVRQSLAASREKNHRRGEIEGRLAHMSLPDILQFLHMNRKHGELKVGSGAGRASVFIRDGEIQNALLNGIEGEKALYRMLGWEDGRFEFVPGRVGAARKMRTSTSGLLMEGMRQIDEYNRNRERFPDPDAVLSLGDAASSAERGSGPLVNDIIHLVEVHQTVRGVVDHCTASDFEVYSAIADMIETGVLASARDSGAGADARAGGLLTREREILLREKILARLGGSGNTHYARILLIAASGELAREFIEACALVPGMRTGCRSSFAGISMENPLGEAASISLLGGLGLHLYSVPAVRGMAPLWQAFSTNLVGAVLVCGDLDEAGLAGLAAARSDLLSTRRVPVVNVLSGDAEGDPARYARALGLGETERVFKLGGEDSALDVFGAIFDGILSDGRRVEYAGAEEGRPGTI